MAVLYAKGLLAINENYVNAGPLGTTFTGKIVETTKIGKYEAIVPTLQDARGLLVSANIRLIPPIRSRLASQSAISGDETQNAPAYSARGVSNLI